jgi:site-specific DNA recombinase
MTVTRRCAVYTRKSSDEGLEQSFNSLDAQREACIAYVVSQRGEGWKPLSTHYDDGGFSGGNMERPALQHLLADIDTGLVDVVVVYKVDRLTRSLADFAKIVERFDQRGVSFVSVTQQFNTTTSMGRLTLNVLLSFAQFEREVTGERIRDKIAASKRKGMWMGGYPPLGYDAKDRTLVINPDEAQRVRTIFEQYLRLKSVRRLKSWLDDHDHRSKYRVSATGRSFGGAKFSRGALYTLLQNRIYLGEIVHKGQCYPGAHRAILDQMVWNQAQELLAHNRVEQVGRHRAKEPSLLVGLLFDGEGHRLTPIHSTKLGKRYRYYETRPLETNDTKKTKSRRVSAHDLEHVVVGALLQFLQNDTQITTVLRPLRLTASENRRLIRQASAIATGWEKLSQVGQIGLLKEIIHRIVLDDRSADIEVSHRGVATGLLSRAKEIEPRAGWQQLNGSSHITAVTETRWCRSGIRLITPEQGSNARSPRTDPALIKAVARAHVWREHLLAGDAATTADIAGMAGVSPRYVRKVLNLIYVSPRLVEAILAGRQRPDLTLTELCAVLPIEWLAQEQRNRL